MKFVERSTADPVIISEIISTVISAEDAERY